MRREIEGFLQQIGIEYEFDEKNKVFEIALPLEPFIGVKLEAKGFISIGEQWVLTAIPLMNIAALREEDKLIILEKLLKNNFNLSEVNYGLADTGDIVVHAESHIEALNYKNFQVEFYGIIFGVIYFLKEILPSIRKYEETVWRYYIR